jgi:hypothetical protein
MFLSTSDNQMSRRRGNMHEHAQPVIHRGQLETVPASDRSRYVRDDSIAGEDRLLKRGGGSVRNLWSRPAARRSRLMWAVTTTVLVVLLTLVAMAVYPDWAKASPPDVAMAIAPATEVAVQTVAQRQCNPDRPCPTPANMAARFRSRSLGSSQGHRLPLKVRRLIRQWDHAHPKATHVARAAENGAQKDLGDWWDSAMGYRHCMVSTWWNPDKIGKCMDSDDGRDAMRPGWWMVKKTTEVRIVCGGAGVIGALKGGGLWGAGRGAGACLWTYAVKDGLF